MDEDKKNKKKKIAVIIILVAIIAELIYDTDYSTVDVLDIGQSFMRIISGLFILIELFIFNLLINATTNASTRNAPGAITNIPIGLYPE